MTTVTEIRVSYVTSILNFHYFTDTEHNKLHIQLSDHQNFMSQFSTYVLRHAKPCTANTNSIHKKIKGNNIPV